MIIHDHYGLFIIPLDPPADRSWAGFPEAAFAGWFYVLMPFNHFPIDRCTILWSGNAPGADGPAEERWIRWNGHQTQTSEWSASQSHANWHGSIVFLSFICVWYFIDMHIKRVEFWQPQHPSSCHWSWFGDVSFWGDATKQLEQKPQSPQRWSKLPRQTARCNARVEVENPTNTRTSHWCDLQNQGVTACGHQRVCILQLCRPSNTEKPCFCFPILVCSDVYFIWGSTLSWTIGMLWIVMTCCSDTCHDWLILVVGLPPFPSWPSTCRSLFRRPAGKMSPNTSSWRVRKTPRSPEKDDILVGGLEHVLFSHILGIVIPID